MPQLLTLVDAAKLLDLSPETLRKQAQRGNLHAQLVGKTYVVTPADVERYRRDHLGRAGRPKKA